MCNNNNNRIATYILICLLLQKITFFKIRLNFKALNYLSCENAKNNKKISNNDNKIIH